MKAVLRLLVGLCPDRGLSVISYRPSDTGRRLITISQPFDRSKASYFLRPFLLLILVFVSCGAVLAQEPVVSTAPAAQAESISGIVVSAETGEPLEGATVRIKNMNTATVTDAKGKFTLFTSNREGEIEVSFIGYLVKIIPFSITTHSLVIALEEDYGVLEEVTVNTGYQEIPKERATGSFAQPIKRVFDTRVSTDVLSKLNGITSGLIFNSNTGNTINNRLDINIRGRSTINSDDQPLIVVDNFPYTGDLTNINPNDVENVTILKDAAAASIWGARAGNGVIVITTKRGRKNQPVKVSLNANTTVFAKPDLFYNPNFLPSEYYIEVEKFLFDRGRYDNDLKNTTSFPAISPAVEIMANPFLSSQDSLEKINALKGIDVRKQNGEYFYRNKILQQYSLNLSGGVDNATFFLSGGYDRNLESLKNNDVQRISLNSVSTYQPVKNLSLMAGLHFTQHLENRDETFDFFRQRNNTYFPYISYADGAGNHLPITFDYRDSYIQNREDFGFLDWGYVPLDELGMTEKRLNNINIRVLTGLNYKVWKGISADVKFQYQRQSNFSRTYHNEETYAARNLINRFSIVNNEKQVTGYNVPLGGYIERSSPNTMAYNIRGQLNFDQTFGKHGLNMLAGYELSQSKSESNYSALFGYDDNLATHVPINSTGFFPVNPSGSASIFANAGIGGTIDRFRSVFALGSYSYDNKYIISGSARVDGSNYFGVKTNQKSVPLWSVGAKWAFSKEKLYDLEWLPRLNLTASYGYSGNLDKSTTGISTFSYLGNARWTNFRYASLRNIGNPELRWEKIRHTKVGVDFASKNNIVSGSLEYYMKKGTDLIGTKSMPPSSGVTNYRGNYSEMKGSGMDIQLNTINTRGTVKWYTSLLLNTAYDKITKYEISLNNLQVLSADALNGGAVVPIVGKPLFSVYSLPFAGLDPENGNPLGILDGEISSDYNALMNIKEEDLHYHGSGSPTVYGGLTNTIDYKKISLTLNLNYKMGYYIRRPSLNSSALLGSFLMPHRDYIGRWQQPGDELFTSVPSIQYPVNASRENFYRSSSALIEKGDHVRLQDILLSYAVPSFGKKNRGLQGVQVYGQLSNIGVIWKASKMDLDPDLIPGNNFVFPNPKTVAIGVKADF
jgi:TonB-linked SusC/RagA family outer membrane protein